jgi:tetratricopeptide (TPR) repeat protein
VQRAHLLPATLAALVLFACGDARRFEVEDLGTRAVVIGIDGADWKVIDGLIAEGDLPHLARFKSEGVWGEIETLREMPLSPVIWTSVATGKSATHHGISWFMVDQPDGSRAPVRSTNRRVSAIWNVLAEAERRPVVVGWWATYPAEDVGSGVVVSDALGFHGFGSTAMQGDDRRKTWPADLFPEVDARVPPLQQIGHGYASRFLNIPPREYRALMFEPARATAPNPHNPIHLFQQYAVTAEGYTAISEHLLEEPYDLFMVYFEQVDSFSHLFMKYAPPRLEWVEEMPYDRFNNVVREWYRHQDELLGRLLEKIDLSDTAVFLLSDHGFKSGERRIRSEQTVDVRKAHLDHEPLGVFAAMGPHLRSGGARVEQLSVLDMTPTLLYYLGFPVAKDLEGTVVERLFTHDFVTAHPIGYVPTFEPPEGSEPDEEETTQEVDPAEVERNLEALRALGYVGGDSTPASPEAGAREEAEETSPELLTNLGRIHLARGEVNEARSRFEEAIALDPDHADALLALGDVYRLEGRVADAELVVKRALQVDPNSIGALAQLAELQRDLGRMPEAIRLFEEALALDDSRPFLFLGYGDVLQRAGRFGEAERAFRSVLELDPDSFKARYNLGVTYGNSGRIEEAIRMYEEALAVGPGNPEAAKAANNLGAIYLGQGDVERARQRFSQAVAASRTNLEARFNLALIHLDRGEVDPAIALLEQAAALDPNHEQVHLRLGLTYLEAGRAEDAYRSFLLVRRLYPSNWQATLYLALLHAASGQPDQARPLLSEALQRGGAAARELAGGYPALAPLL